MYCGYIVHWIAFNFDATDAGLVVPVLHQRDFGLSSTKFRPPIAA